MTETRLSQFKAGREVNSRTLGRNTKSNSITFVDNTSENLKYIADAQFNDKLGILSIIKQDGDQLEIGGFLTKDQLGRGDRGDRGIRGKDARNGDEGKEGKKGDDGCPGDKGEKGKKGRQGRDGTNGPVGLPGGTGCDGLTGDPGLEGDQGDKGFKGELGKKGISCIVGPIGPQGPKPKSYAYIGSEEPGPEFNIWAVPFEDSIPELENQDGFSVVANDIDISLIQVNNNTYGISAAIVISSTPGLKGNAEISWSGDYSNDSRVSETISANSKTLTLDTLVDIERGEQKIITGSVTVVVRDTYDDTTVTKTVSYKFTGFNNQTVPQNLKGTAEDISVVEGHIATFTLNLDQAVDLDTLVTLTFTGATSRMSDSRSTSITIPVGQSSVSVSRSILYQGGTQSDSIIEGVFTASGVTEETPGSMTSTATIVEVLSSTPVAVSDKSFTEGDLNRDYLIPITLTGELEGSGSIDYEIIDGSAIWGTDYSSTLGKTRTVQFTSSYQTINIPVRIIGNTEISSNRQFTIGFSNVSDNLSLDKSSITCTIFEDDVTTGGDGCLLKGTLVDTPRGPVKVELLAVGDEVISRHIKGLPDASKGDAYTMWKTSELLSNSSISRVESFKLSTYHTIINVNDLFLTPDHPILVSREGKIFWEPAGFVRVGDLIESNGGWTRVDNTRMQTGNFEVVTLDVEPYDVYYAQGILVHNAEDSSFVKN